MATGVVKKVTKPPTARNACEAYGIDRVCEDIAAGKSLSAISQDLKIHISSLLEWIEGDSQRSARTREARTRSARLWDERAEQVIYAAADKFELEKAKELAHHYRWRAKAIAPRDYGDKVTQEHTGKDGGPITMAAVNLKGLTDAELEQMQTLLGKAEGGQ